MIAALTDHLWQSTLFALGAALLVWALRRNGAHVRHAIWVAASLKFLVPFALVMNLGAMLIANRPHIAEAAPPVMAAIVDQVARPFAVTQREVARGVGPAVTLSSTRWIATSVAVIWFSGFIVIVSVRARAWRRIRAALRASRPFAGTLPLPPGERTDISMRSVPGLLEPGVVGVWRPILLMPEGVDKLLTPGQLRAVITHELWHVRRRDNLTAAFQMAVESLCWFHPVVWWIGARMIEERERACDEHVLRVLGDPDSYAEGIVRVCRQYVESPLACVAGVTGASLKKRIKAIVAHDVGHRLTAVRKVALTLAMGVALGLPLAAGAVTAPLRLLERSGAGAQSRPQQPSSTHKFDVASIKINTSGSGQMNLNSAPGGRLEATNVTLRDLIVAAYDVQDFQVVAGPDWLTKEHFDVEAKAPAGSPSNIFEPTRTGEPTVGSLMLQALLAERFKLEVHRETRQMPVQKLTFVKPGTPGPALKKSTRVCDGFGGEPESLRSAPPCGMSLMTGMLMSGGVTMADVASWLSRNQGRLVVDRTGSTERFEFTLKWTPDKFPPALSKKAGSTHWAAIDDDGPSLPTALREQLGLKLEGRTGQAPVLVIDGVVRLIPN